VSREAYVWRKTVPDQIDAYLSSFPPTWKAVQTRWRDLGPLWTELFAAGMPTAACVDADGNVWGFGLSVFVGEQFAQELKSGSDPALSDLLLGLWEDGRAPFLLGKELREENDGPGLTVLAIWTGIAHQDLSQEDRFYVTEAMSAAFETLHSGYRIRELLIMCHEANARAYCEFLGLTARVEYPVCGLPPNVTPTLMGIDHQEARTRVGARAAQMIHMSRARFELSDGERQLVLAALDGGRHEDLAHHLCISVGAVKKRWSSVYDKTHSLYGELADIPDGEKRGREKKRILLDYMRRHMEELRP
jgi:hypothetical protein